MFRLEDLIRGAWHDRRGMCGGYSKDLDIENGCRVRAGGEPLGREVLAVRAQCHVPSHLLTVRSVELGSLGSAKPGAICVNNPLQSRNSHAKLQTTPRPSEINRHAAGTTSLTCLSATQKASVDSRIRPLEIAVNPHRTQRGRNARSSHQRKSSETRRSPAGGNQRDSRPRTPLVGRKTRSWVILVCAQRGSSLEH